MGKHLWSKNNGDEFVDNQPGCMWGIIHALDYHHWNHNVKKMLPHKRHYGRRRTRSNGSPRTRFFANDAGEVQKLLDVEASHFLVNESSTKTSSTNKSSLKARIKAFISEEMSREEDCKQQSSHFPTGARLQRTYSIHHLESLDHGPGKYSGCKHPIISRHKNGYTSATRLQDPAQTKANVLPVSCNEKFDVSITKNVVDCLEHNSGEAREILENQKLMEANQLSGNASNNEFKDYLDVLEIFNVKKELFLKILQNTDDGTANCLHSLQASNMQARLTKSGSFPAANFSHIGNSKQNEVWAFPKGEKLVAGTQEPNLVASKFLKDLYSKSGPVIADDSGRGSALNQETSISSLGSTRELDDQGSNEIVMDVLKHIKQRIEHEVKKSGNESSFTSLDASLGGKEITERWKESTIGVGKDSSSSCETDGSVCDLSKSKHKRTSSLNESLNRYNQLFEYGFSREAKWNLSKSLKLTNENAIPSDGHASISFRRIHSLPHLDSYRFLQNEVSCDAHFSGMPIRTVVERSGSHNELKPEGLPISKEKHVPLYANEETDCLNNTVKRSDSSPRMERLASITVGIDDEGTARMDGLSEKMDGPTIGESNTQNEPEINFAENASNKLQQQTPFSVLESCFQQEETVSAEFSISEGLESWCDYFNEDESSVNSQDRSGTDSLSRSCRTTNPKSFENISRSAKSRRHIQLYTEDDTDFNYVREILEQSGFTGDAFLGTWHMPDQQPLDPSVFEEVEACLPHEPECSEEDIIASCHRQLLFDLVNEVLLQIFDKSFCYYPRALSFSCHIRPMPQRNHVFEEVWASINRTLSSRPDLEQPLDFYVAQDLAKGDDWMNLQLETECVALELEELIFDELLEEVIRSEDC
ncbi:uncharacterized protein LOC132307092 [Cornus florida]|uniref:uncharacterized protein LOC132307092 n=1 Tax=Cornus florida TaxID=4283 RepID=UPI0028A0686C|nr:uncharacterized protein LOC132307092 [Cornus florida]